MIYNSNQSTVPYQEQTYRKKKLEELNMMDAFLFDVSTEKPEDAVKIARTIVKRVMGHDLQEITVENQKQFQGMDLWTRGIRMDLWVRENERNKDGFNVIRLYDIEPNIYEDDLPKRSRFYQAKADAKELPTGSKFKQLPELIMIWILPYDPFGDDRMLYTVKNMVVENNKLVYNDGVLKLFLYTKGKIGGIKRSRETEDRYMTLQEIIDHEKDNSYNDGVRAGVQQGLQQGLQQGIIRTCQNLNQTKEKAIEALM